MECVSKIRIPNPKMYRKGKDGSVIRFCSLPGESHTIEVPCGSCYVCLQARREQWAFRLAAESNFSIYTWFLTLTFAPGYSDGYVHKGDLQKFFKRLRKRGLQFRYYAIGEYGTKRHRPHYHVMLFIKSTLGTKEEYYQMILQEWPFGYVTFGDITPARVNYVLHYHVRSKVVDGKRTFAICSKSLGVDYFDEKILRYFQTAENYYLHDAASGIGGILPRYYRAKFGLPPKMVDSKPIDAVVDDMLLYVADLRKFYAKKLENYNLQNKF